MLTVFVNFIYSGILKLARAIFDNLINNIVKYIFSFFSISVIIDLYDSIIEFFIQTYSVPYYVITIIDYQTFTMSLDSTATTFTVSATVASNDSITCESTVGLTINQPIIFTGTTFGGIVAGETYYIREVFNSTSFSIATSINGSAVDLSDVDRLPGIKPLLCR